MYKLVRNDGLEFIVSGEAVFDHFLSKGDIKEIYVLNPLIFIEDYIEGFSKFSEWIKIEENQNYIERKIFSYKTEHGVDFIRLRIRFNYYYLDTDTFTFVEDIGLRDIFNPRKRGFAKSLLDFYTRTKDRITSVSSTIKSYMDKKKITLTIDGYKFTFPTIGHVIYSDLTYGSHLLEVGCEHSTDQDQETEV